jgi:hypothetical protein
VTEIRLRCFRELLEFIVVAIVVDARPLTALGAWLITMAACVSPAWSEPWPLLALARAGVGTDWAPGGENPRPSPAIVRLNALEALAVGAPAPAPADPDLPTLTTSVAHKESTDLRLLLADGERWSLMEFGAAATWRPLAAKLTASGQLPYVATGRSYDAPAFDSAHEPASLGVKGEIGGFEAGAQYRSVGKRLDRLIGAPAALKDREGHEMWVAQRLGLLRLRVSDSELTDNVDRNPALPRTTTDQSAVTAELSVSAWPVLALTYASGDSARVRLTPQGREGPAERRALESVTGSAYYYGGPGWDVTASSTLSQSRPAVRPDEELATMSQDLSLTLRLLDSITAVPAIGLGQERSTWSTVRSDTGTAGLTLSYAPPASRWWASTFVSYTSTRTSDGSTDGRSVSLGGALSCALGRLMSARTTLSFEAGYDRYADAVVPASSSRAISGFVLLKVAGF